MKRFLMISLVTMFTMTSVMAQVTVAEPEHEEEVLMLTSNSKGVLLDQEKGTIKASADASLLIVGAGKMKSRLTVKGVQSASTAKGSSTTRLIIRVEDNSIDPKTFIDIFQFEVTAKERRHLVKEIGVLMKTDPNQKLFVDYKAQKYGKSSYLVTMTDLLPGEYGIVIKDPEKPKVRNGMKVTSFTVE